MALDKALYIAGLTWWTTDEELKIIAEQAGSLDDLVDEEITFLEHKVNGKSKGIAYMRFKTAEGAEKTFKFLQEIEIYNVKPQVAYAPLEQVGNPFRLIPTDPRAAFYDSPVLQQTVINKPRHIGASTNYPSSYHSRLNSAGRGAFSNKVKVFN